MRLTSRVTEPLIVSKQHLVYFEQLGDRDKLLSS